MLKRLLLLAAGSAALASCADTPLPTLGAPAPPSAYMLPPESCNPLDSPCSSGGTGTVEPWPFYVRVGLEEVRAAGDPRPDGPGIYLGEAFTPQSCFAEHNPSGFVDTDRDWLSDSCEYELARAFAPEMQFSAEEVCGRGEPYWAAKYFPGTGLGGHGVVRFAYMPAYYEDCGTHYGGWLKHSGDSEFVMVEAEFNFTSRHWQFRRMWLSAHYGTGDADRSAWVEARYDLDGARFGTHRRLGRPQVWVAVRKHANYRNLESCNNYLYVRAGWTAEKCFDPVTPVRFPVLPQRNVGSRHVYIAPVYSRHKFYGNGRREAFYTGAPAPFNGWNASQWGEPAAAYDSFLRSDKFELLGTGSGPGPAAPDYSYRVAIDGLGTMTEYTTTTWTATVSYGTAPFTFQWYVDGVHAASGPSLTRSAGAAGTEFTIKVRVQDAGGQSASGTKRVVSIRPKPMIEPV